MKTWLWAGNLSEEPVEAIDTSLMEFDSDQFFEINGDGGYLPFAQSLVDVANEVYAFFSAAEEPPEEEEDSNSGSAGVAERVGKLERMLETLSSTMEQVSQRLGGRQLLCSG